MNQSNLLQKLNPLGVAVFSAISFTSIAILPAQAANFTQSSSLQWTGDTFDFTEHATNAIVNEESFSVTFNPSGEVSVRGASGDFVPYFSDLPNDFATNSITVDFNFLAAIETPPGFQDAAEFQLGDDLIFSFQTPAGPDSPVTFTLPEGSIFTAELDIDGGVEVELDATELNSGGWEALLPNATGGDPNISGTANSSTFTFDQSEVSIVGVYSTTGDFGTSDPSDPSDPPNPPNPSPVESEPQVVPEPGSILGFLTIGGLCLLLKGKKQS